MKQTGNLSDQDFEQKLNDHFEGFNLFAEGAEFTIATLQRIENLNRIKLIVIFLFTGLALLIPLLVIPWGPVVHTLNETPVSTTMLAAVACLSVIVQYLPLSRTR
jgi:hypothetical protein